jgi:hypothetical protein
MKKEYDIEVFNRIQKVKAPAYLKTRIAGRLTAQVQEQMPLVRVYSLALAIAILFVMNFNVLAMSLGNKQTELKGIEILSTSLGITSYNQLYND